MDVKTVGTRTIEGREVPPFGTWTTDPAHSDLRFVVNHMMIAKIRGRFRRFTCTLDIAEQPEDSSVEAVIDAASIDTGDPTRDEHLRSADFLDVERFPEIRFRSTSVRPGDHDRWQVAGELTVRDVTRPVELEVEYTGATIDPWGNLRAAFSASTEIDREEFGVTWNQALEAGGFLVGRRVRIEIDIEAVHAGDQG
jgi:polyisoprenoid-binding protein YceI